VLFGFNPQLCLKAFWSSYNTANIFSPSPDFSGFPAASSREAQQKRPGSGILGTAVLLCRNPSGNSSRDGDHRIPAWWGRQGPLWSPSPTPCPSRVTHSRGHSTAARRGWNISREGDSPASLGSPPSPSGSPPCRPAVPLSERREAGSSQPGVVQGATKRRDRSGRRISRAAFPPAPSSGVTPHTAQRSYILHIGNSWKKASHSSFSWALR